MELLEELGLETPKRPYKPSLARLRSDDRGQDMVEYALVAALIGLSGVSAIKGLSTKIGTALTTVGTDLDSNV
jgi:pilus assembly protein Flp/PilA